MSKRHRLGDPIPVSLSPAPRPVAQQSPVPAVFGSDAAPVIYFDGVIAHGVRDGVIQLELAMNQIVPVSLEGGGKTKVKVVVVAHLRCTTSTAFDLAETIEKITTAAPPLETKQ
jgi:hypothetical protein